MCFIPLHSVSVPVGYTYLHTYLGKSVSHDHASVRYLVYLGRVGRVGRVGVTWHISKADTASTQSTPEVRIGIGSERVVINPPAFFSSSLRVAAARTGDQPLQFGDNF